MAKTYVTGDQQSDQSVISSIMRKRGFIPRLNEVDTQTRENRKDRKANVEVLPASTAIINVYQLIDKVDSKGKKFKKYYPNQKPGIGFAGFNKIRGKLQASEEEVIEKPAQSQKAEPKATTKRDESYGPTNSSPPADANIQKLRDEYSKLLPHGRKVWYQSNWETQGTIIPIKGESDIERQSIYNKFRDAVKKAREAKAGVESKQEQFEIKTPVGFSAAGENKIKADQAKQPKGNKPEASVYASKDGVAVIKELRKLNVQYLATDQAKKVANDNYYKYDLSNPGDITQIQSAITIMKNNKKLASADKFPYPMALVGEKSNSPTLSKFVYVRKEDLTYRKNKHIPTKVKRPLHKKPLVRGNKRKVVLRKKGGKR